MPAHHRNPPDPGGVDLICAETGLGPACTGDHIEACVSLQVPLVVFHHDPPPRAWSGSATPAGCSSRPAASPTGHPEYQRRLIEARSLPVTTTAFGPEWPAQRYRLLPARTVAEWAGREHQIPDPPPGPAIIGHTTLFPHSAAIPYDMPKFLGHPARPRHHLRLGRDGLPGRRRRDPHPRHPARRPDHHRHDDPGPRTAQQLARKSR